MRILIVALVVMAIAGAAQAQAGFLLDFGEIVTGLEIPPEGELPTPSPDPYQGRHWNNVWTGYPGFDPNGVATFTNLVDTTGAATGVSLAVSGFTTDGIKGMPVETVYPQTAQEDNVGCKHGEAPGIVTISGLTEPEYTIGLFSSITNNPDISSYNDDTRRTDFTVGGLTKTVHCYANTDYVESFWNVAEPVGGVITVQVTGATPGGDATYSYGYLNVMEIVVPEPATLSLLALGRWR